MINLKIFKHSNRTHGKSSFQASDLALKPSRPLHSLLNTDQEVFHLLEVNL